MEEHMGTAALKSSAKRIQYRTLNDLKTLDDGALVTEYLAGQPRAFDAIVERYQARLLNFIYRTVGDRERSEDLVQEVFIRVHRHLARFDRGKKFSTWIYTIASNLAKNELRNRSRNPIVLFQTMTSGWEDEERPLEFEDPMSRPDDLMCARSWNRRSPSCRRITARCSCSASSRAARTRRSPRSRTATSAP
jgi:RNA polymerase sigma factor (sigma-70 family)